MNCFMGIQQIRHFSRPVKSKQITVNKPIGMAEKVHTQRINLGAMTMPN